MPDLKNKYSDPELNPANKGFDEIVNRPDMKALDDQGNAIARDLEQSEKNPTVPGEDTKSTPENRFNYGPSEEKSQGKGSGWSRRRKILTGAGVGGGASGILALIFMLLPLKLPGIMDMIANEAGQRVEQVTEKRAKTIIGRAILTKFGTHTGIVITGDGALSTLIASMRESGLERRLAAKGLTIEQSGNNGVKIRVNNELLENGRTLRTDAEVLRAMDGNRLTNKMIKDLVKEDIPSWRWMKRAKFAKWMRIKYGIPRYGLPNDSTEQDSEKRAQELQKARLTAEYENTANNALDAFDCIMGEDCVADNLGDSTPGNDTRDSENLDELDASIREAGNEVAETNSKSLKTKVTETLTKTLIGKIGAKAIPFVGWIDLAATLDHIAHEALNNDYFSKLPAYFRGLQYAQLFGSWSGYSDQQKLGALDNAMASPLAAQLDGAEESQAFNYIEGDASKGTPVKLKVNSNNPSEIKEFWDDYKNTIGNIPGTPGNKTSHFILNIYYETIGGGGALGWLSDKAGGFLAKLGGIFTPDAAEEWMKNLLTKGLSKMMDFFGLTIDPLDAGPDLFNNLHAGGTVSFNDYCNDIGCRKLTPQQTAVANSKIAQERAANLKDKGVAYALFSPENTKSLTSQLAFALPTPQTASVDSVMAKLGSLVRNTPATLGSLLVPRSSATTAYVDLYGVDPYGATAEDLNKPLTEEFARGDECTETVEEGSFDTCTIDTEVAEAMICEFKPESEQCSEDIASTTTTGEGIDFTVGSYNILHSDSHADKSRDIGGCSRNPVPGDPNCARTRAALQVKIITGQVRGIPAFDIVGTQETSPDQYRILKEMLPTYAAFPKDASRIHNQLDGAVALFWNTEKFSEFASGKFESYSNVLNRGGDGKITNPWVGLQASNGQKVYITTVHYATEPFGGTREKMIQSAQYAIDWVKTVVAEDSIVIVTGDMNDRLSDKLTYCVFTRNGILQHARDMMNGLSPEKECPAPNNVGASIDHIYATPTDGLSVTKWADPPKTMNSILTQASDHTPVYAKYSIAGDDATNLNIATFNILHVGTDPYEQQWRERLPISIDVLKKNSIGVAGLQEVRPQQHDLLTSKSYATDTYDIFPKTSQKPDFSPNPVIWDKSTYKLISGKTLPIEYDSGSTIDHAVLVQLEDNSGNQFYVLNTHDPANARPGSDNQNALSRLHNAQYYKQYLGDLAKEGKPIFLTGDFNSAYTMGGNQKPYNNQAENLTYCVISSGGVLKNVWDILENHRFTCPRNKSPGPPIDHIYTANTHGVSKVWTAPDHQNGSDHPTLMASVVLTAGGTNTTSGDWAWPVDKKWWNSNRADFLGAHPGTGTAWGADNMGTADKGAGIGADVGDPPDGSPVYAMLGGTVTSTNLCGSNDGIAIKSKIGNATVGISYMHGTNKKFNVGDTVKAGDHIMNIGTLGCNVYGGHVHIGIAYNGKYVCPQDVFIAMGKGDSPNLANLVSKARAPCGR